MKRINLVINRRLIYLFLLCGLSISGANGQTGSDATPVASNHSVSNAAGEAVGSPKVRIGPGDLLEVKIFDVPELSQTVRVNDVGDATLNLIGRLHMSDLTVEQAQSLVAQKYVEGNFLISPQVSVFVHEYVTQGVSVFGEVTRPGVYPVLGTRTLFDVLSEAGGITQMAGNEVTIRRASDGSVQTVALSGRRSNSLSSDIQLDPGDKVVVPRAGIVYVIGDVSRPGGYVMQDDGHMTMLQAVAMALGAHNTASMNKAKLIRKSEAGYVEVPVALNKILKGEAPDQPMQAEDILYVPNSTAKSMIYRGAPAVAQAAVSAAIYRAPY